MKKYFVLVSFILGTSFAFAQKSNYDQERQYENYFKEFPFQFLNLHTDSQYYRCDQLYKLSIKQLFKFARKKIVRNRLSDFDNWYYGKPDTVFDNLIYFISEIPGTKKNYYSLVSKLDKIKGFSPPQQIYYTLFWNDVFSNSIDSIDLIREAANRCYDIADLQSDKCMKAECYLAIGKFIQKYNYVPSCLDAYFKAMAIYDDLDETYGLGRVNKEIASVFEKKTDVFYAKQACYYYQKAADYFYKNYDFLNGDLCTAHINKISRIYNLNTANQNINFLSNLYDLSIDLYEDHPEPKYRTVINEIRYFLLSSLGNYFESDTSGLSNIYYSAALLIALNDLKEYSVYDVYDALQNFANYTAKNKDTGRAITFMDVSIDNSERELDNYYTRIQYIKKSEILSILNRNDDAVLTAKKSIESIDSTNFSDLSKQNIKLRCYSELYYLYTNLGKNDSAKIYSDMYYVSLANHIDEIDEIKNIENDFNSNRLNKTIKKKQKEILRQQKTLSVLKEEFAVEKDSLDVIKSGIAALYLEKEKLLKDTLALGKQITEQLNTIKAKETIISKTNLYGGLTVAAILAAFFIVSSLQRSRIKFRNAEILASRSLLQDTRSFLNAQSKSRIHNVQNNYTNFLYLLRVHGIDAGKDYAKKCAKYFRSVLNKWEWEDGEWSISDELKLMYEFLATENVLGKNIEIIEELGIDPKTTKFESEVFSTILSNSIKHGFKEKNKKFTFRIKAVLDEKIIYFEVSDNGSPAALEDYLNDDDNEHGLKVLKRKIEIISKLSPSTKKIVSLFSIEPIIGVGTTIKFAFPYETIKGTDC